MYRSQSQSEAMLAIPSGNLIDENRTKILINCEQIYMEKKIDYVHHRSLTTSITIHTGSTF